MKRKKIIPLGVALFLLIYYSCRDYGLNDNSTESSNYPISFSVGEAQEFFEMNATDLAPLSFNEKTQSRNTSSVYPEMSPDWGKAIISGHKGVTLIEIPLRSTSTVHVARQIYHNQKHVYTCEVPAGRRLVIAKRSDNEIDMFVTTIIPEVQGTRDKDPYTLIEDFRYLGGSNFTGMVFCSTLGGKFVKAFGYTNGKLNGTLCTHVTNQKDSLSSQENPNYEHMLFNEAQTSVSRACSSIENSSPKICKHGYTYADCPHNCALYGGDFDDVWVVVCPYCGTRDGCNCPKCFYCGEKERNCQCVRCAFCHKKIFECTCYDYPDPDKPIDPDTPTPPSEGGDDDGPSNTPDIPDPCDGLLFNGVMEKVLKHEGGFVNDPEDPGKATNKGIAWDTWQRYAKSVLNMEPTLENLKKLTSEQAISIYETAFWNRTKMETIDDPDMRYAFFDFYVNAGGHATKVLQKTLNALQTEVTLKEDGAIGPKTIACLNSVDHKLLYNTFIEARKKYYQNLVKTKPNLKKFLNGWLNRTNTFKQKTDSNKYNVNC